MASLVVTEGPGQGAHFPLKEPIVSVGRDDTCTYQILDKFVSRQHLQVRLDAAKGRHVAGDYRSAHGVFVNGKQILLDTVLNNLDTIKLGRTTLVYLAEDHADAQAALAAATAKKEGEWGKSTLMGPS